ncbi:MAG: efflux transporter periplasmic adaptor subunit [Bacteroidetes bacterium GWF2_49_14]|nr:MAG: efflux transporter periplasmic adaptor subunit [Bacteroidetes bacterium GWF2_49_14]
MDRIIENKSKKRRRILWISLSVLVVTFIVYLLFFTDHSSKLNVERDKLTISDVIEAEFLDYMTATGNVEPLTTVYLDAVEGGRVEKILIEEGSMVNAGDIILRLTNPDLNLRILTSQADLAEQENRLRDTKIMMEQQRIELRRQIIQYEFDLIKLNRTYLANKTLFNQGLISEQEYLLSKENAELTQQTIQLFKEKSVQDSLFRATQVKSLEGALDRMQDNIELVKDKLESLNVKAPVTGQLGSLEAEIGQTIISGYRLGQIHILDNFKVTAQIDEHWIDRIRTGLPATLERNDQNFNLNIIKVYPEVRGGQFQVDMEFSGVKPDNIRTGQTYRINVELGQPIKALQVLKGGFFESTGGQWIYVVDPSGQFAIKRTIRTGRMNPRYYEILEGLQPGEKVVVSSYTSFGNNDKLILK